MRTSRGSATETLTQLLCREAALRPDSEHGFPEAPGPFRDAGIAIGRGMLSDSTTRFLLDYAVESARCGRMRVGDGQVANAFAQYGNPVTEFLLDALSPLVERATGLAVYPTYSFMRIYGKGDVLRAHTDRVACEVSVTLALGIDAPRLWPFFIRSPQGVKQVNLLPGDMLVFRGVEYMHWRNAFDGVYAAQVFLHYVDQSGPYAAFKFDRRSRLNYQIS